MDKRDWIIGILSLILWALTVVSAYNIGVENGYWEHEGEENAYSCPVFIEPVDIRT